MTADHATELSDLLRERRAELGLSLRELADRCLDPDNPDEGSLWKRSTLANLEKGDIKPPKLAELRALAAGLDCPLGRLQDAAGSQFFGLASVWGEEDDVRVLVRRYRQMSPEDQRRLQGIVDTWSGALDREESHAG
ncbi:helix-turn-helix transcriptional regulator [Streptomyces sp. ODS28]|uniref:helix-turn-helix domain-containing protein n=1 Tax=Streptomyces sp. ODS28 TaxID=3136688 RepID=UPI0031E5973E